MEKITAFVAAHLNDDISRLLLNKGKWPDIDMDLAVSCIESRRKLKGKIPEWADDTRLVFPSRLSAEQCSSSATGRYKASLAARIAGGGHDWKIADLTGGLGVDSWFFSQEAAEVLYNEMKTGVCEAAAHNFKSLGCRNIIISNHAVGNDGDITPCALLEKFRPDIVYLDPARRGEGGRKVFLIEECTPDVLTIKDDIFKICRHILIKLSPMADISMVCGRLGMTCREVHAVASGGECKELLIWMDREWNGEYEITATELHSDGTAGQFRFRPSEEALAKQNMASKAGTPSGKFLFEPGKALMKAGGFNLLAIRKGIACLGTSTHYYMFDDKEKAASLRALGKIFRIKSICNLDKRSIKAIGKACPNAEVTARNIPMDTETLRKKLGVTSGDDAHIFGLKSDTAGNLLIVTERILSSDVLDGEGQERPLQD